MKKTLLEKFKELGFEEFQELTGLNELRGDFINLECRLPNGSTAKLLDDQKRYYGAEVCKKGSDRCYGLAADEGQLLVYEYGEGGSDAELVLWKKL